MGRVLFTRKHALTAKERSGLRKFTEWGDRRDSNPRQPVPQTGALPTELRSPFLDNCYVTLTREDESIYIMRPLAGGFQQ